MSNNPWLTLSLKSEDDTSKKSAKPARAIQAKIRQLAPDQAMRCDIKTSADIMRLVDDLPSSSNSKVMLVGEEKHREKAVPAYRLFRPDAPIEINATMALNIFLMTKAKDLIARGPLLLVKRSGHKMHVAIPQAIVAPLDIQLPPDADIVKKPYVFEDEEIEINRVVHKGLVDLNLLHVNSIGSVFTQLASPQDSRILQYKKVDLARIHSPDADLVPAKSIHWNTFKSLDRETLDDLLNQFLVRL